MWYFKRLYVRAVIWALSIKSSEPRNSLETYSRNTILSYSAYKSDFYWLVFALVICKLGIALSYMVFIVFAVVSFWLLFWGTLFVVGFFGLFLLNWIFDCFWSTKESYRLICLDLYNILDWL